MARQSGRDSTVTRQLILTEAIKIFEEKGYQLTTMRDIEKGTQLSKGTLYYHFNNKDELFLACIKNIYQEALLKWEKAEKDFPSAVEKLYAWVELSMIEMKRPIIKSLLEQASRYEMDMIQKHAELQELLNIEVNLVKGILEEGIERGEFKSTLNVHDVGVILLNLLPLSHEVSIYGYQTLEEQKQICLQSVKIILEGIQK